MENNTELLKEYASLAGREDAKSEARKAEILSYIKTHANDADREEAKAFIGQKMEQIKDNVEVLRKQIETEKKEKHKRERERNNEKERKKERNKQTNK